jgi:hypothetical protein
MRGANIYLNTKKACSFQGVNAQIAGLGKMLVKNNASAVVNGK